MEILERLLFIAQKKYLNSPEQQINLLEQILQENSISQNMSELHQHGIVTWLIETFYDYDQKVPYNAELTAQNYSAILQAIYRFLINSCMVERVISQLQSPMTSPFNYPQLLNIVEQQYPSAHVVYGIWTPSMLALAENSEYPKISASIANLKLNALHKHEEIDRVLQILNKTTHMFQFKNLLLSTFQAYCNQSPPPSVPLNTTNMLELLQAFTIELEMLVETEWNRELQAGLDRFSRFSKQTINLDDIRKTLNTTGGNKNLFNQLSLQQGDNFQCIQLFTHKLDATVGSNPWEYRIDGMKKMGLAITYQDIQSSHNLSDNYMARLSADGRTNLFRDTVTALNWNLKKGKPLINLERYFIQKEEAYIQEILEKQKQHEAAQQKAARLELAAQKKAHTMATLCACHFCQKPIPFEMNQICKDCFEKENGYLCSICGGKLETSAEMKASTCNSCNELLLEDFMEQQSAAELAKEEALKRMCFMCKQMKSPSDIGPAPALNCEACLRSFNSLSSSSRFAIPNPQRQCPVCRKFKLPSEMSASDILCYECKPPT